MYCLLRVLWQCTSLASEICNSYQYQCCSSECVKTAWISFTRSIIGRWAILAGFPQIQGDPQKLAPFLCALTLSNIKGFSKLFHCQNQEKRNNTIPKDPTTPQVCCYTALWNVTEWGKLSHHFTDRAIGKWRHWLECVVQQQGRHIEHLMEKCRCDSYFRQ